MFGGQYLYWLVRNSKTWLLSDTGYLDSPSSPSCCLLLGVWISWGAVRWWHERLSSNLSPSHRIVMICLCDVWWNKCVTRCLYEGGGGAAGAGHVELVPSPRCLPSCHLSPNYPGLVTSWWIVTPWQPRLAPPLYISYWQVFRGH